MALSDSNKQVLVWSLRAIAAVVILAAGVGLMAGLAALREAPQQRARKILPIPVTVQPADPEPVTIELKAFGTVRSARVARLGAEIAGRVTSIADQLRVGRQVAAEQPLFTVDTRTQELQQEALTSQIAVLEAQIQELREQRDGNRELVTLREERLALTQGELDRVERLFTQEQIGTQSEVDQARQQLIQIREQLQTLQNSLALLPRQIHTLEQRQAQVRRELAVTEETIARAVVRAPFAGRLRSVDLDVGDVVTPGAPLITLVDDTDLEVAVSIDGREVARWLRFQPRADDRPGGWFPPPAPVEVAIRWLGGEHNLRAADQAPATIGTLDRLQEYHRDTRTVTAIIRVPPPLDVAREEQPVPLVPGMFCEVRIPGQQLPAAVRLPRAALTDRGTVYIVEEGKLAERQVNELYADGDTVIIAPDLPPGTPVVVNRLSTPLLGQEVEIRPPTQ